MGEVNGFLRLANDDKSAGPNIKSMDIDFVCSYDSWPY